MIDIQILTSQEPLLIMLFIFLMTFISEDLAGLTAGTLSFQGSISLNEAIMAAGLGIYFSDLLLFFIGLYSGKGIGKRMPKLYSKLITQREWYQRKIQTFGPLFFTLARFIPGMRLPTFTLSGIFYPNFLKFSFWLIPGCLLWTPFIVAAGRESTAVYRKITDITQWNFLNLLLLFLVFSFTIWFMNTVFSYKKRRIFTGKIKKVLQWEFWPTWAIYFPIVLYILYLALKTRKPLAFAATNPSIPASGLAGESKSNILAAIKKSEYVAPYFTVPGKNTLYREDIFHKLFKKNKFSYPVVMKPDIGERGQAVQIIHSKIEALNYLSKNNKKTIIQKYMTGIEYGILYYRLPDWEIGKIYSLCIKEMYSIKGNGLDNLETLILKDSRAVAQSHIHLTNFQAQLNSIPAEGESIALTKIGTHSRGSLFLDINDKITTKLTEVVDQVAKSFSGFYFGRFDVRSNSESDFFENGQFQILELNGITGEPASMYDPKHRVFHAWKTLAYAWKMIYEIGIQNLKAGHSAMGVFQILAVLRNSK